MILSTRMSSLMSASCQAFDMPHGVLFGQSKSRGHAWPRQVFCWVAVNRFGFATAEVGRKIGRDHTSVMHAIKVVSRRVDEGDAFTRSMLARLLWATRRTAMKPVRPRGEPIVEIVPALPRADAVIYAMPRRGPTPTPERLMGRRA